MTAEQLISASIVPLQASDSGDMALEVMAGLHVRHLPVVSGKVLLGVISEDELLDGDTSMPVSAYRPTLSCPFVRYDDHVIEVIRVLTSNELTAVPVLDDEQGYLGCISSDTVLYYFSQMAAFTEPGSIVLLEMNRRDYSLAEIARITESEDALILSSFVRSFPDSSRIEVTLKVNRQDIGGLVAAFQRFNFEVKAYYQEEGYADNLRERYNALMAYLNV
jgi:acetoin utilization protein AcuB